MNDTRRFVALALLAGGGLVYEIALTRLLSVLWFDSFVYVLLAIAVLGIGIGAGLATAWPSLRRVQLLPVWAGASGISAALVVPGLIELAARGDRVLGYGLVLLPYAGIGLAIATLFAVHAEDSPRLYLADLAGAGVGGLLAAPAIDALGGTGGALAGALAIAAAAPYLRGESRPGRVRQDADRGPLESGRLWWWIAAGATGAFLVVYLVLGWPAIDWSRVSAPKPITERIASGAESAAWRWDALARTDLVVDPPSGARFVYLDGGAGSLIPDLDAADTWAGDVGAFAFEAIRPERAYLLGSGGGLDIALARRAGVDDIVAAEVNEGPIAFSRELEPGLYGAPVRLLVDEGRSALRREGMFDLILLSQTVTQNAELHGLALTENALYTVEAFRTYLEHLAPGGAVAFKLYDELTLTRAITTALAALATGDRDLADATDHLVAVLDARASPPVPLLLVRERPFDRDDAVAAARTAERLGFSLLFVPGLLEPPPLDAVAAGTAGLDAVIANSPDANLAPPRDHQPFFWQFEPGVPRSLQPLLWALAALTIAILAATALGWRRMHPTLRVGVPTALLLGAGFMLAEIALLQRVQLLVGRPTLALGAGLGTLLVAAGVGSALSGRFRARPLRTAAFASFGVVVALLAAEAAWPTILDQAGAAATPWRLLAALAPVALVGLPLGVPFPHLLRALGRPASTAADPNSAGVATTWAVNGLASVGGAVGATALAVAYGFPAVTATAIVCYGLSIVAFAWGDRIT